MRMADVSRSGNERERTSADASTAACGAGWRARRALTPPSKARACPTTRAGAAPERYASLRLADLTGDGLADLAIRGADGLRFDTAGPGAEEVRWRADAWGASLDAPMYADTLRIAGGGRRGQGAAVEPGCACGAAGPRRGPRGAALALALALVVGRRRRALSHTAGGLSQQRYAPRRTTWRLKLSKIDDCHPDRCCSIECASFAVKILPARSPRLRCRRTPPSPRDHRMNTR